MSEITVISLDPGRTTGHAKGVIEDGLMTVFSGQTEFTHRMLYIQLKIVRPDVLIVEQFEFRHGKRAAHGLDMYPKELIGVCELYAQCNGEDAATPCDFRLQNPGYAVGDGAYYNDTRLKAGGLYKPTKGGHANDALRHLLMWYTHGSGFQYNASGYQKG